MLGYQLMELIFNDMRLIFLVFTLLCYSVEAKTYRSSSVKSEFQRQHPCPATGNIRGACPGWVKDHRIGLCVGGEDKPDNLRWMTVADAKDKDKWERKGCRK